MPKATLSAEAFSHTPPGLWTAKGLATYGKPQRTQTGIGRERCHGGEADQHTRSETGMELVLTAKERRSQGRR